MNVVLDTNIWISFLGRPNGMAARTLGGWFEKKYEVVSSEELIAELEATYLKPHLQKSFLRGVTPETVDLLIRRLRNLGHIVTIPNELDVLTEDPDDNKVLWAALQGEADVIVFGDRQLLDLGSFEEIPIVAPREFVDKILPTLTPLRG